MLWCAAFALLDLGCEDGRSNVDRIWAMFGWWGQRSKRGKFVFHLLLKIQTCRVNLSLYPFAPSLPLYLLECVKLE